MEFLHAYQNSIDLENEDESIANFFGLIHPLVLSSKQFEQQDGMELQDPFQFKSGHYILNIGLGNEYFQSIVQLPSLFNNKKVHYLFLELKLNGNPLYCLIPEDDQTTILVNNSYRSLYEFCLTNQKQKTESTSPLESNPKYMFPNIYPELLLEALQTRKNLLNYIQHTFEFDDEATQIAIDKKYDGQVAHLVLGTNHPLLETIFLKNSNRSIPNFYLTQLNNQLDPGQYSLKIQISTENNLIKIERNFLSPFCNGINIISIQINRDTGDIIIKQKGEEDEIKSRSLNRVWDELYDRYIELYPSKLIYNYFIDTIRHDQELHKQYQKLTNKRRRRRESTYFNAWEYCLLLYKKNKKKQILIMSVIVYRFCTQPKKSIYVLENAQKYISDLIQKTDWISYSISKHIPKQVRQDYLNICQFQNELSRIEETTKERSLGIGKMQYWTDQIDQIYQDNPQRDPLSICLHHSCKSNPLPKYLFQKMINFRKQQIEKQEFANLTEMVTAAESNRGPQLLLFLRLLRMDIENSELKQLTELASQSIGIVDYLRRVPYTLQNYKLNLPEDVKYKHDINVRSLWDRVRGEPKEELYDAILEVAAFARTQLIKTSSFQNKIPSQSFRAFLHLTPTEQYLEDLEYYNFKIFEKAINQNSYIQLPMQLYKNSRKQKYLSKEYQ